MNNQEINNKLEQLEADLNTLKESMSISEENISLLMIIANQDEKIKQLKRELSIQKTISDTQFTITNPTNFDKIDIDSLLLSLKKNNHGETPELCIGCSAISRDHKTGKCFFWNLGKIQCGFKDMASERVY